MKPSIYRRHSCIRDPLSGRRLQGRNGDGPEERIAGPLPAEPETPQDLQWGPDAERGPLQGKAEGRHAGGGVDLGLKRPGARQVGDRRAAVRLEPPPEDEGRKDMPSRPPGDDQRAPRAYSISQVVFLHF